MNKYIVVFVTAPNKLEAKKISAAVLNKKLAACANMLSGIDSHYWWRGKIERAREVLIIMKTSRKLFARLAAEVKKNHSYEVPEIIALPIIVGSKDYLKWIGESIAMGPNERRSVLDRKR
jgi:periplasmic divalent cation tolerance protein